MKMICQLLPLQLSNKVGLFQTNQGFLSDGAFPLRFQQDLPTPARKNSHHKTTQSHDL